jgi:hypothetical protein
MDRRSSMSAPADWCEVETRQSLCANFPRHSSMPALEESASEVTFRAGEVLPCAQFERLPMAAARRSLGDCAMVTTAPAADSR